MGFEIKTLIFQGKLLACLIYELRCLLVLILADLNRKQYRLIEIGSCTVKGNAPYVVDGKMSL